MTKAAENLEKKIEAQLEKLKQLKARKQAIEAKEKSKQKEQERKDDTRRKILLGSYLIKKMQENEANKEKILSELDLYLTEDRDRKLFNLEPLNKVYSTFQEEYYSYKQASEFLENEIRPLVPKLVQTSIYKYHGIWVLRVIVDKSSEGYSKLLDLFEKPIEEKTYLDDFDDDVENFDNNNELKTVDYDDHIINVELDGYPADYDRNSLIDRD